MRPGLVKVRHYHKPNGRLEVKEYIRTGRIGDMYKELNDAGFVIEHEVLTTGEGSMTVGDDDGDYLFVFHPDTAEDFAEALNKIIEQAYQRLKEGMLRPER